jgi:hypothetical protein
MSLIRSFFSFGSAGGASSSGLVEIYPMATPCDVFIKTDILATYLKILTDVAERTHGLSDDQSKLLWDSCVQSDSADGIITLLADAMLGKAKLFLVYNKATKVVRRATANEATQIAADYEKSASSKIGIFISFEKFRLTDVLRIYSALEYCILSSLHKTVNIAKAVQLKMNELRASVALADADVAADQARSIAEALRKGEDILIDAKDSVSTSTPDTGPTKEAISFLDAKRSFYLRLPLAYISGLQTGGIGSTGEADMRAIERGLLPYFVSILRPVLEALFGVKLEYRSQDFRQIESAMNAMKTFDLVSDDYLSKQTKRAVISRMMNVDPVAELKLIQGEADAETKAASGNADVQKQAFNGAQITSMVEIVTQVATGQIPRDSALQVIMLAFQVDAPTADKILASAGRGFVPTASPAPGPRGFTQPNPGAPDA